MIVFQYNPDTLTRTLQAQAPARSGDRSEALRLKGPPVETIKLDVEIDAADQLETRRAHGGDARHPPAAGRAGDARLPDERARQRQHAAAGRTGTIEIVPPVGAAHAVRVGPASGSLPVRLTEFSVTEEAFDPSSTRSGPRSGSACGCSATTTCRITHPGYYVFLAHQVVKETHGAARQRRQPRPRVGGRPTSKLVLTQRGAAVFDFTSRYSRLETAVHAAPDGREVAYMRRRFLPPAGDAAAARRGDRRRRATGWT